MRCCEAGERRADGGRGHAAPVHGVKVVISVAEAGHHPQQGLSLRVDMVRAEIQRIAQRRGHDLLLRRGQVLERGPGRWGRHAAPDDLVVAVVGDDTLGEALDHLLARRGVVVEVVLDRIHHQRGSLVRAGLDLARAVDEGSDDRALRRGQLGPRGIHVRALHVVRRILIAAVPQLARHRVVVEDIPQVLGDHELLRAGERRETRARCGGRHAGTGPVDQGVAVVR